MAKSIPALVTPEVLVWARNLDRITIDEAASRMNVKPEKLEAWEDGSAYPTLRQAKELSKFYRVPFVYFYLPDIPRETKRLDKVDYRTFGNNGEPMHVSRELRWLLRDIEDRRDSMLELYQLEEHNPVPFELHMPEDSSAEGVALQIRQLLGLTAATQKKFRKPEKALAYCIAQLEALDVLVFQAAKIDISEMRGMSVGYDVMPIIVLNRKDENSARLFSLIHELAHIVMNTTGICTDIGSDTKTSSDVELLCNKIAGLVLVPDRLIKNHKDIQNIKTYGLDDVYVNAIARDFAVNKEVIIHRLCSLGIITRKLYFETLNRYTDEYRNYAAKKKSGGRIPPAIDKGTQVGRLYTRTVLSAYHGDKISARDASAYLLNLGAKHFSSIERWCV